MISIVLRLPWIARFIVSSGAEQNEKAPATHRGFHPLSWGRGEWGARQQVILATRRDARWFLRQSGNLKIFRGGARVARFFAKAPNQPGLL
jgi:hypothetical protein